MIAKRQPSLGLSYLESASGIDFAFENFRVRSPSGMCKTAAMFSAIEILLLPPYATVVPFFYVSHCPDSELSRFGVRHSINVSYIR